MTSVLLDKVVTLLGILVYRYFTKRASNVTYY